MTNPMSQMEYQKLIQAAIEGDEAALARVKEIREEGVRIACAGMRDAHAHNLPYVFMLSVRVSPEQLKMVLEPEHPALPFLICRVIADDFREQAMAAFGEVLAVLEQDGKPAN